MLREFLVAQRRTAVAAAMVVALGAAPLAACGIKGPLKPPPATTPAGAKTPADPPAAPAQPAEPKP